MSKQYIILGTRSQIFAINPKTKQQLKVNARINYSEKDRILDIYTDTNGVFHASEGRNVLNKNGKMFWVNFARIYDSISGNSFFITPPAHEVPHTPSNFSPPSIEFKFVKKNDSLFYTLDDKLGGVIFQHVNGKKEQSEKINIDGKVAYFDGRKIALSENLIYADWINAKGFERAFKKKNNPRYKTNKSFFSI